MKSPYVNSTRNQLTAPKKQARRIFARLRSVETHQEVLTTLLSKQERDTARGFPSRKRYLDFIAGRVILKLCLRHLLSVDYRKVDIRRDTMGRPLLCIDKHPADGVSIAISHGGDFVYCGAALETKIGLDVEPISEKLFDLRELWTTPEECDQIASQSTNNRNHNINLTRLWSSKESLAKYLDAGLEHVIKHAHLITLAEDHIILKYTGKQTRLNFRCETVLHRGHIFAFLGTPLK